MNELKKSIDILYDMELNNYLMLKTINTLERDIDEKNFDIELEFIPPERKVTKGRSSFNPILVFIGVALFIMSFAARSVPIIIVGSVISSVFLWLGINSGRNQEKKENIEYDKAYERVRYVYDWKKSQITKKHEAYLISQRDVLIDKLDESKKLLTQLYDASGIDKDFQNIVAIGYMHEFLRLKIATKLEGVDGLYYLIKKELRWDRLNDALNDISNKLDTIIDNQRDLFYEIRKMNSKCDEMIYGLKDIAATINENTESINDLSVQSQVISYNTNRIAKEAEYRRIMNI